MIADHYSSFAVVLMPYSTLELIEIVDGALMDLKVEENSPQKKSLKIKLLKNIQTILLDSKQATGFCAAINCLEDGGYFSYKMIRLLVKLIPETSCGHIAILTALSLAEQGIDFSEFIDLMTKGDLKAGQLVSERKMYFDLCP